MKRAKYKLDYKKQLSQPEWFSKRKEIIERDKSCVVCKTDKTLEVHHLYYENDNRPAWDYDNESMITLCRKCHYDIHNEFEKITALISIQAIKKGLSFTDIAFKLGVL